MTSSINKGNNRYPVFHRVINNLLALLNCARCPGVRLRPGVTGGKIANFCTFRVLINQQGIQIYLF